MNTPVITSSEYSRMQLIEWCHQLTHELEKIASSSENNVPKKMIDVLHSVGHYKNEALQLARNTQSDPNAIRRVISTLFDRSKRIGEILENGSVESELFQSLVTLKSLLSNPPDLRHLAYEPSNSNDSNRDAELKRLNDAIVILTNQLASAQNESNNLRREIKETAKIAENLNVQTNLLDQKLSDAIVESLKKAESITEDLLKKQDDVNKLVGMVSGSTIAGSFAKSAEDERQLANSMRNGSVLLMLTIVLIVGYSFFETAKPQFDWQTGAFRLLFSIALSIPAAYLARESSKHRTQQYSHLKVSLDLQAITPYLASLPTEDQHKLKLDVANKIFGAKDNYSSLPDSYPVNLNDLITTIASTINSKNKKD